MSRLREISSRLGRRARVESRRTRAIRARWAEDGFESQLVWVFGSPRSGSTWLLYLLAEHPAIVPVNEPLIGVYLTPFLSDLPGFDATSLETKDFSIRKVKERAPDQFFSEQFSRVWEPALGRMMRERFKAHAVNYPPDVPISNARVVLKEPNGSQSADLLMRALPGSRLLFLLRDGRDVVDSELAANLSGSWVSAQFPGVQGVTNGARLEFAVQSAHKWLWRTEVVQRAYAEHRGPRLIVRYEELLRDPTTHLREIFAWLELPIDESRLAAWIDKHSFEQVPEEARGAREFFREARPGAWRENLSDEEQSAVEDVIGPKLRELDYAS